MVHQLGIQGQIMEKPKATGVLKDTCAVRSFSAAWEAPGHKFLPGENHWPERGWERRTEEVAARCISEEEHRFPNRNRRSRLRPWEAGPGARHKVAWNFSGMRGQGEGENAGREGSGPRGLGWSPFCRQWGAMTGEGMGRAHEIRYIGSGGGEKDTTRETSQKQNGRTGYPLGGKFRPEKSIQNTDRHFLAAAETDAATSSPRANPWWTWSVRKANE